MGTIFGPAGTPDNFPYKTSIKAPLWFKEQGMDCFEYQCGKGVHVSPETCEKIGAEAKKHNIKMSLHAPYFINLANPDPQSLENNIGYIMASCEAAQFLGADRIVVHTGALMKRSRDEALNIAKDSVKVILGEWESRGLDDVTICLETMGKINQLGDLNEVLTLCELDDRLLPCVDFGHLYARSLGKLDGIESYRKMLDEMENRLGKDRAGRFHSHFSQIEYTQKGGEKCHRTFADNGGFGPDPLPLMEEIARRGMSPTFICESSGTQTDDALVMKNMYLNALNNM